ncbi:TolB family protein [Rhodothermus marinus]|uniref:TolB family protein n=1 Tax=Rhodothermus marinus TaxID=29549 RepID=UPI001FB4CE98|nr:hypothetical protein [Rhodothermus marinus]
MLEHLEVQGVRLVSGSASEPQQGNSDSGDPSVSADGRYVAFVSRADNLVGEDTNESPDIFVRDRQTGTTERVNVSSSGEQARKVEGGQYVTVYSRNPSISADGRYVAFDSDAYNLVSKPTYGTRQVYVHDRKTGETLLVSMAPDGTPGLNDSRNPSISADVGTSRLNRMPTILSRATRISERTSLSATCRRASSFGSVWTRMARRAMGTAPILPSAPMGR